MRAGGLGDDAQHEAYVRILVTRGIGELSYDPATCPAPSIVVIAKPHVNPPRDVFEKGVGVSLVPIVRNHPGSVSPLIKSNNLLNNALAMQEAFRRGLERSDFYVGILEADPEGIPPWGTLESDWSLYEADDSTDLRPNGA